MGHTALGSVVGMLAGVGCAVLILRVTYAVIGRMTAPQVFEIEYSAIYLIMTLGAGFGAVCGALAGFAAAVLREWRRLHEKPPTP